MESVIKALNIDNAYGLIAQLIGFFALICCMTAYQMKTQKKIVTVQIISCTLFTIHFLMLGAYTGALLNFIAASRSVVFANKDKKWAKSNLWLVFFSAICVIAGAFTWEGIKSIMPMLGMILTTVSWGIDNAKLVRLISLPSSPLWIVYNFISGSMAGVLTELFVMVSIITAMIRLDFKKNKTENEK